MEEQQEDREDSATQSATGNPSQGLPAGPPDAVNLENISLPVDQVTSAGIFEPLTQYPETVTGAKSHADVAGCQESEVPKLENELQSGSEKNETTSNIPTNENSAPGICMQNSPNPNSSELHPEMTTNVLASSSQVLEIPEKNDNHENVTGRRKPKENNETDCEKLKVLKMTINDDRSNSTENNVGSNVFANENQAEGNSVQDAPTDLAELRSAQKITVKALKPLPKDLETPGKIDNPKTDSKKSKSPIIEVRQNSEESKKRCNVSVDLNGAQGLSLQKALSFAGESSELHPHVEITVRALDLETFEALDHDEIVTSCERPKNQKKIRCDDDSFEGDSSKIVTLNESSDGAFGFSKQPKMAEGSKNDENPGFSGKVTTLSATDLKSRLDMEFFDPADHVEIIFPRDGPSKLAGGSTGSLGGRSSSRGRNRNLWRVVTGRLCRGFRKCNWFPKMCSCLEGGSPMSGPCANGRTGSYERLGSGPSLFDFSSFMQRARRCAGYKTDESVDNEKQAELTFYNDDLTWTEVCVEKNLRTMDLCELLKVKRNATGNAWSIVETWPELGIERTLEDHEDILATHREMEMFASHHERKFYFRKDFLKYEFFISPKQFFPAEMVAFPNDEDRGTSGDVEEALRSYLARNDAECPQVFSLVWIRDETSSVWKKTHMLLQGRKLYTTKKAFLPSTKFLRSRLTPQKALLTPKTNCSHHKSMSPDHPTSSPASPSSSTSSRSSDRFHHSNAGALPKRTLDHDPPSPLAHLSDYYVYKIPNAKKFFNAPFEWGACLRPSSNAEAEDTEAGVPGLKVIAFTSEKSRACWLTAMRLAKYGKQLRENYRAFRNKQCEQNGGGSPKEQYSSYNVPNESLRSRVAMDFTGSVGRIVEDPKEAKDIAESEGIIWRRRWRPFSRPPPGCAMVRLHGLDGGIHVLQPWFHSGLNRDIAAAIIKEHGSVDGVFLVRESKSNPGAYVLTYKYSEKVFHAQIQPIFDERRNCWLYTLDKGATKFYDLLQLIEFYQLNSGSLPTRLTHYVQNGVTVAQQRQEDGGASPSPPFSGTQNMSPKSDCPKSSSGI